MYQVLESCLRGAKVFLDSSGIIGSDAFRVEAIVEFPEVL